MTKEEITALELCVANQTIAKLEHDNKIMKSLLNYMLKMEKEFLYLQIGINLE